MAVYDGPKPNHLSHATPLTAVLIMLSNLLSNQKDMRIRFLFQLSCY